MILPLISLDRDFAMSELGDLMDVVLGMIYLLLSLWLWLMTFLIFVCGGAVLIRQAHVNVSGMFAGSAAIFGYSTGPAFAITGCCAVHVLQSFVIDVGIGVGGKGPDLADVFVHM